MSQMRKFFRSNRRYERKAAVEFSARDFQTAQKSLQFARVQMSSGESG